MLASGEQIHHEWLGPGLELVWLHAPQALQAALALQLDGGSHHEPLAYPGLAHFLEHLVFRGSQGFAPGDGLMSHVQAHGGQVNASTRGTHTLFHLQIDETQLAAACARLVDQLQRPLLDSAVQVAERDVLEAEFRLRATDVDTLIDAAVGQVLNPQHGAARFQAGRRSSLPVEDAAFQAALLDYHRRIYRQARVRLVVVSRHAATQGLPVLRPLLQDLAGTRDPLAHEPPPQLGLNGTSALQLQVPGRIARGVLAVALERDGQGASALLGYLNLMLESTAPGSLTEALRASGLASTLVWRLLHGQDEQALLLADFQLQAEGFVRRATLSQVLVQLLAHCRAQLFGAGGVAHCQAILARRWPILGALEKARYLLEQPDHRQAAASLDALIAQLRAGQFLLLSADSREVAARVDAGFELALAPESLPASEMLELRLPSAAWPAPLIHPRRAPATWRGALQRPPWGDPSVAALFLLWPDSVGQGARLQQLQQRLEPVQAQAWQQGVRLDLRQRGSALNLQLLGAGNALPAVLHHAVGVLREPWPLADDTAAPAPGSGIALRQLLQALPQQLAGPTAAALPHLPVQASALLLSDDHLLAGQLAALLDEQGVGCEPTAPRPGLALDGSRWQVQALPGEECALLLFVPAPAGVLGAVAWQLLGQLLVTPFQRRLREELQLCYALFCGHRLFDGQAGLLFAVQSASADARAIWTALQHFIQQQAQVLAALDAGSWNAAVERTSSQLQRAGSSLEEGAQTFCQAWLAGQLDDYPHDQLTALASVTPRQLADQLQHLLEQPWLVLSNQARPPANS